MGDKAMGEKAHALGRRGFLKSAVVTGVAGVFASSPLVAENPAMKITSVDIYQTAKGPTKPISGQDEIYVKFFPGPGGKWQVYSGGGAGAATARNCFTLHRTAG
jgi:hypothetical protein